MATTEKQQAAAAERQESVSKILESSSPKKVVVAGPGTGKTHLFKQILKGKRSSLTLSFINALIDDLALDLYGASEVRTLHSYARGALGASGHTIRLFPKLSSVIGRDAETLLGEKIAFDALFYAREEGHAAIPFYINRRRYYDHFGYTDIVLAVVRYFEEKEARIPEYDQVLVDEYQDFNLLEVSLIDLLSRRSPILIAGDDDQALYDFKLASPEHIRKCHGADDSEYEPFNLPFCSRCTRVIVDATNDVVAKAKEHGLLVGRIDKPYRYFDEEDKDADSNLFPTVVCKKGYARQAAWLTEKQIEEMAAELRDKFSVLVISPTATQCSHIAKQLRENGLRNVEYVERPSTKTSLLEGLELLLDNPASNLGWRIALEHLIDGAVLNALLEASKGCDRPLMEYADKNVQKRIRGLARGLKQIRAGQLLGAEVREEFYSAVGVDPWKSAADAVVSRLHSDGKQCDPAIRKVPIKVTSIPGSKGLAADLVIIANFDDRYFVNKDGATDQDVCNFLVAITRARKKVVLLKTSDADPTFLSWIDPMRISRG